MKRTLAMLTYLGAWCAGCTATETGNPVSETSLALTARSSDAVVELATSEPSDAARVHVDEAWVVLGDIRFVQSAQCDSGGGTQVDIPGPTVAELVGDPTVLEVALARTTYCRLRVPLERADDKDNDVPAELRDHAILLRGTRADGTAFALRTRQKREAEIRSRGEPFSIGTAKAELILAFDVGRWLAGVDLDGLSAGDDGVVRVDEDSNRDQLDVFDDNVEQAMELFRDRDHDGRLADDEAQDALASGGP